MESLKQSCLKGLQHSDDKLDRVLERLREDKGNAKYVSQDVRAKRWVYVKEKAKSFGYVRMIIGVIITLFLYLIGDLIVPALESYHIELSVEKMLLWMALLLCSNVFTAILLLNEKVKKRMGDIHRKDYFNLQMFQKESPVIWDAFASLVNVYTHFTFKELKEFIEKNTSTNEYLDSIKNWDKERLNLTKMIIAERKKAENAEDEMKLRRAEQQETYAIIRKEVHALRKEFVVISNLLNELKNKTARYKKSNLKYNDLTFVGGFTLYVWNEYRVQYLKSVGLKRKRVTYRDVEVEKEVSEMINRQSNWYVRNNKLLFLFYQEETERELVMQIEVNTHYKEYFKEENEYMVCLLYDFINICLDLTKEFNGKVENNEF